MVSFSNLHKISILLLLIVIVMIIPVSASLQISGTVKYMENIAPGATVTFPIQLSIANTDPATDYTITVFGFGNDKNGNYVTINPESDVSIHTARPYITLDKSVVSIKPGTGETVTATVTIPATATGGLYALINIHPSQGTGMVRTAINVPVMLTVTGTPPVEIGNITSITAEGYSIATIFTNTGNHHYYSLKNTVTIVDKNGSLVFTSTTDPVITAIVPGESITFVQPVDVNVPSGEYNVASSTSVGTNSFAMGMTKLTLTQSQSAVSSAAPQTQVAEQPTPTPKSPIGVEVGIVAIVGVIVCMGILRRK
jgi:uncharacterized membrane protein